MIAVLALCGWSAAAALAVAGLRLRARLERAARAEHELRGPVTVLRLALERLRPDPGGSRHAPLLEAQVERLRAGLADLQDARRGRRSLGLPSLWTSVACCAGRRRAGGRCWRPAAASCAPAASGRRGRSEATVDGSRRHSATCWPTPASTAAGRWSCVRNRRGGLFASRSRTSPPALPDGDGATAAVAWR